MRIKKKILSLLLLLSLCLASIPVNASEATPDSKSVNGVLIYDKNGIYSEQENTEDENIESTSTNQTRTVVGYTYVPGYERLVNESLNRTFKKIWATSVEYVKGASVSYTLTVTKSKEATTAWNVGGTLEGNFNISKVKAKLQATGGYNSSETVYIYKGETWSSVFESNNPGTYELAWYIRGYKYYAQCGTTMQSTGTGDGQFYYYTLGTVTFPSDEIHFAVTTP